MSLIIGIMNNNRPGNQNINDNMGLFNNLMGNFANVMGNVGNQTTDSMRKIGESLGNWGQQMGQWGQHMSNVFTGNNAEPNITQHHNTRPNQYHYNYSEQRPDPNNDPNFNPFDYIYPNNGQQQDGQNYFSNDYRNSDFDYYQENRMNFDSYDNHQQNNESRSNRNQRHQGYRHQHRHAQPHRHHQHTEHQNEARPSRRNRMEQTNLDKKLFNEAKVYIQKGEYQNAIDNLLQAMEINDLSKYNQLIGFCYLKKQDYNLALALFKNLIEKDPNNSKLHRLIGISYMKKAKLSSSMNLINKGVEHFYTAYEITNSNLNYRNYLNAKKLRFLAINEIESLRKTEFIESIRKYEIDDIEKYLKKNCLETPTNLPEHFRCAITLVS